LSWVGWIGPDVEENGADVGFGLEGEGDGESGCWTCETGGFGGGARVCVGGGAAAGGLAGAGVWAGADSLAGGGFEGARAGVGEDGVGGVGLKSGLIGSGDCCVCKTGGLLSVGLAWPCG